MAPNDRPSKPLPKDKERRRRELERLRYERQARNRAQAVARARKRTAIIGGAVVAVVAIGAGTWALAGSGGKKKAATASASATASAPATASSTAAKAGSAHLAGCTTPAAGTPTSKQWKTEPAMAITTTAAYTMTIDTNCGAVTVTLDAAKAPHTVNSFAFLAAQHFFDHVTCHRLTTSGIYVLQCGDPTGSGSGGPGYKFKNENLTDPSIKGGTYPAGTVAMANSGADTNGSQFFLVYKDSSLPANYTPFGTITGGLATLQKIATAGTDNVGGTGDGHPLQTVTMNTVTVTKG